jgi:hypothetical protein
MQIFRKARIAQSRDCQSPIHKHSWSWRFRKRSSHSEARTGEEPVLQAQLAAPAAHKGIVISCLVDREELAFRQVVAASVGSGT